MEIEILAWKLIRMGFPERVCKAEEKKHLDKIDTSAGLSLLSPVLGDREDHAFHLNASTD